MARRLAIVSVFAGALGLVAAGVIVATGSGGHNDGAAEHRLELMRVKRELHDLVPRGVTLSGVECEERRRLRLVCTGTVVHRRGAGEAEFRARMDRRSGHYEVSPIFAVR